MTSIPADVSATVRTWLDEQATVAQACGVLSVQRGSSLSDALAYLETTAITSRIDVDDLARQIVAEPRVRP